LAYAYPNQAPIIGIYTQEDTDDVPTNLNFSSADTIYTYISASYVKYIQMSGAQVVPIFSFSNQSEIAALLPKLNGVLFTGG
jgi:gamma-glutamyl hydrolase